MRTMTDASGGGLSASPPSTRLKTMVKCALLAFVGTAGATTTWAADRYARDMDFLRAAEEAGDRGLASGRRAILHSSRPDVVKAAKTLRAASQTETTQLQLLAVEKGWPTPSVSRVDSRDAYSDRVFMAQALDAAQRALKFWRVVRGNRTSSRDIQAAQRLISPGPGRQRFGTIADIDCSSHAADEASARRNAWPSGLRGSLREANGSDIELALHIFRSLVSGILSIAALQFVVCGYVRAQTWGDRPSTIESKSGSYK